MDAAKLTALIIAITGLVGGIAALIAGLRHTTGPKHNGKP